MKAPVLGLYLLLAPALRAQPVAGGVAQVFAVTDGRDQRFRVPQVRLPDAAVARRINRQLLRQLMEYDEGVDSTASPRQQVRQASRACCYDSKTRSWAAGGIGYSGTDYRVLLNRAYLLSFEFTKDYDARTALAAEHLTFDLRTGKRLTLGDLVADPPAQLARRLDWAVDRRLKDELAKVAAIYGDSAVIADVALMYGLENWNTVKQKPTIANAPVDVNWYRWADFALDDQALLLFYNVSMSRISVEFLPEPVYTFPFARIHPQGLLIPLAKAADAKKAKTK
jgi:hypothetical protein